MTTNPSRRAPQKTVSLRKTRGLSAMGAPAAPAGLISHHAPDNERDILRKNAPEPGLSLINKRSRPCFYGCLQIEADGLLWILNV